MVATCLSSTLYIVAVNSRSSKKKEDVIDFQTERDGEQKVAKGELKCKN